MYYLQYYIISLFSFVIPMLLITAVDLRKSKTRQQTSDQDEWGTHKDQIKKERGRVTSLMRIQNVTTTFAYEVSMLDQKVSVVCSPYSVYKLLAMLLFGAEKHGIRNPNTTLELSRALGFTKTNVDYDLQKYVDAIRKSSNAYYADGIFIDNDKELDQKFVDAVNFVFGPSIESINMRNKTLATYKVNEWVRHHTNDKITKIMSPSDLSSGTVFMLVSAFYILGSWEHRFKYSYPATFYGSDGRKTVNLMNTQNKFKYGTSLALGAEAILVPFAKRSNTYMLVLLPHERDGLDLLLQQLKLAPELINKIRINDTMIDLHLPKFKIETSLDLVSMFKKIGLKEIFSEETGLKSVLKSNETVKVDKAVQKAVIEVNEWGTRAGEGSLINMRSKTAATNTVIFKADHPFLFFIIVKDTLMVAGTFVG